MAIQIHTTQNVILDMRAAGLGPRILAHILDWIFIILWVIIAVFLLGIMLPDWDTGYLFFFIIVSLPVIFYDLLFEYFNDGQSPGKMILKIKVVNTDGTRPSFGSLLLRWLFRLVDFTMTSSILAVIMVAVTEKSQRLGDVLAGTTVIILTPEPNSTRLSIPDLDFHENYSVVYNDILDKLNDRDINIIRSIVEDFRYNNDPSTLKQLTNKIKETTGYEYNGNDRAFLKKIIDDYNYLSVQ